MEKQRTLARSHFTRAKNELAEIIGSKKVSEVQVAYEYFSEKADNLFNVDSRIKEQWLMMENFDEDNFASDQDAAEIYKREWFKYKIEYENLHPSTNHAESRYDSASVSGSGGTRRRLRLPKLDMPTFDGNAKNWIRFWGLFKKVHTDENLDNDDKFAYLLQSMETESPARALIESFPPSGDNYHEAVKQLKARYARDELLIEIYVRELLALVLEQVKGNNMSIASLYDRMKTQLRALDTLGVTSEKYAAMLYPLVESALPAEMLRVWERQRCSTKDTDVLSNLLNFVKIEVESEERIQITRRGITLEAGEKKTSIPTAACLVSGEAVKQSAECIWCGKPTHNSLECYKAQKMSLEARLDVVSKKKACTVCLKVGHMTKKCRSSTKCILCSKRHSVLLCPEVMNPHTDKYVTKPSSSGENAETMLSNNNNKTTLLQTLLVKCGGVTIRALIDTGAQRSYIKKDVVSRLGLKTDGEEVLSHCLFGGIETEGEKHNRYHFTVRSMDNGFEFPMTALDKAKICGYVPRIRTDSSLHTELRRRGVKLSDVGSDLEVGLLIGADYAGFIMTPTMITAGENLFAIKTKLGWTLQGVIEKSEDKVNAVVSLTELGHLWNLEVIGIESPSEKLNQKKKKGRKRKAEKKIMEDFKTSVKVNDDMRYEVNLPWKVDHPELLDTIDNTESEYLGLLINRGREKYKKIEVGDVVLMETDAKRLNWPLGVVLEVYEGKDKNVRVAKIKTADGMRVRPVQRLYPLELKRFAPFKQPEVSAPLKTPEVSAPGVTTRLGREVKPPKRLDL